MEVVSKAIFLFLGFEKALSSGRKYLFYMACKYDYAGSSWRLLFFIDNIFRRFDFLELLNLHIQA